MDHDDNAHAPEGHGQRTGPSRLALIELLERDGRVSRVLDVHAWPVTLGRALGNDLVIDDPHTAAHHATLRLGDDGRLHLQVGDTLNGLQMDGCALAAGQHASVPEAGALLQLGTARLRLRRPGEALAAEKPLPLHRLASWTVVGASGVLLAAVSVAERWAGLDPGADLSAWMPLLLGLPASLACWAGLWAVASKLFQHRFDFAGHLRIMLPWLAGVALSEAVLEPLAAAMGWPSLWRLSPLLEAFFGVMMLRGQLLHVLPNSQRAVTGAAVAAALAGLALHLTLTHRQTDRLSRPAYMSTLPLPGLVLSTPEASQALVQDLAALGAQLAQRVAKAKAEEAADGSDAAFD
jgi:hypothetical protein